MLRGFGKFSLLLGGLSLLVVSCAQGPVNPAGSDSQAMAIPMAAGEAVLVDEATKQDLIRSARLHGDFRDAESAINRSGKSLDWQERIFGFELKGTEGDSTHALIIMLKGDTEDELDDAVVSVYFKKRALAGYEVKSVLVTQILERDGNRVVETATADLVSGTGARVIAKPDGQPESGVVGKLTGRRNLEQLATFEPFLPPVESLGGRHHALPPEGVPEPGDCQAADPGLQGAFDEFQNDWDVFINSYEQFGDEVYDTLLGAGGLTINVLFAVGACAVVGPMCIATVGAALYTGYQFSRQFKEMMGSAWFEGDGINPPGVNPATHNLNASLSNYRDEWLERDCGHFPFVGDIGYGDIPPDILPPWI